MGYHEDRIAEIDKQIATLQVEREWHLTLGGKVLTPELRHKVMQHLLAGGRPAQIRAATGASYAVIRAVQKELTSG